MLYAIFSDVHGNYDALEIFFNEVEAEQFFCLGDIVHKGKSFDENRCIDLIREKNCVVVRGNHEDDVLKNEKAKEKISQHNLEYLASLPQELISEEGYQLIHSPSDKRILTTVDARKEWLKLSKQAKICFFGHSHQQAVYSKDRKRNVRKEEPKKGKLFLRPNQIYMVNPGGLGLHWGGEQTYVLFDERSKEIFFKRLT